MTGNRSLDEFAGPADEGEGADHDEPTARAEPEAGRGEPTAATAEPDAETDGIVDPPSPAEPDEPAVIEPMQATYAWSATGGPCAGCGRTVETRWRDGAALVCGDCKSW